MLPAPSSSCSESNGVQMFPYPWDVLGRDPLDLSAASDFNMRTLVFDDFPPMRVIFFHILNLWGHILII